MVFSGKSGAGGEIYDITVRESAAAIAVLGGDDLIYRSFGTTNANGLIVHKVDFIYASDSQVPTDMRQTVAVLGRTTGVPVIASCPDVTKDPGTVYIPNCFVAHELTGNETTDLCGLPNACAGEQGCCGRPLVAPIPDYTCEYGYRCSNTVLQPMPNSKAMCNAGRCGCSTRYHDGSTCTTLESRGDCAFNVELCSVECTDEVQFVELEDMIRSTSSVMQHQNWQFNQSLSGHWYEVKAYTSANGDGVVNEVSGIGYGQLVWTVRKPSGLETLTDPGELNVEVHTLPITGEEPALEEFALVTIVPRADCQDDGCQIYEANVKLVLSTDWFFSKTEETASLYRAEFLNGLQDQKTWCVGVNLSTTNNNIEVGRCGSSNFLDSWFFDGITTRLHIAGHPYMCPTMINISNTSTAAYETSASRDGDITAAYTGAGDNLVWSPCSPCNIGAERVLLPDTVAVGTSQLFSVDNEGAVTYGDLASSPHNDSHAFWDDARYAVATGAPSLDGWLGFVLHSNFSCATAVPTATGVDLVWRGCDPTIMFARIPTFCQQDPAAFTVGIFQYLCTQGFGGTIEDFTIIPDGCIDIGTGNLDQAYGYGATVTADGTIVHGGIGYMNNERIVPTGSTSGCEVIVSTSKVPHPPRPLAPRPAPVPRLRLRPRPAGSDPTPVFERRSGRGNDQRRGGQPDRVHRVLRPGVREPRLPPAHPIRRGHDDAQHCGVVLRAGDCGPHRCPRVLRGRAHQGGPR